MIGSNSQLQEETPNCTYNNGFGKVSLNLFFLLKDDMLSEQG